MNRWKLGNYEMTINPSQNTFTANAQNQSVGTVNGTVSNPNLFYTKQIQFQIDIYEDRTSVDSVPTLSFASGTYLSVAEDRLLEQLFMLNKSGKIDVYRKDATIVSNITISGTSSITLPSTNPNYICKTDSGIALLYIQSTGSQLLVTDENGVAKSKYIYSNIFSGLAWNFGDTPTWNFGNTLYTLDSFGRIYSLDMSSGASALFTQMDDFISNSSVGIKPYSSLMMCEKQGNIYLVMLKNKNTLIYIRLTDGKIINNISTIKNNVVDLSYSDYSGDSFILMSSGLYKITTNTARLDIDIIKNQISNGQVTVLNEHSIPTVIYCDTAQVNRLRNMNESRYEVQFNAYVAYDKKGYGGAWYNLIDL